MAAPRLHSARDIGIVVRHRRRSQGLTQAELARRAHVSRAWLSEFEAGKPTAEVQLMFRVIDALGLALRLDDGELDARTRAAAPVDLDDLLARYAEP